MEKTRRKIFYNSRVKYLFTLYILFSLLIIFLFIGWEFFVDLFSNQTHYFNELAKFVNGFPMFARSILLLLWGVFSFLISYIYLESKFYGVFQRLDRLFKDMYNNNELDLKFRKNDSFQFIADSFNSMKKNFIKKINQRKQLINKIETIMNDQDNQFNSNQAKELIKEIDHELSQTD